jgi:hypothetical protein
LKDLFAGKSNSKVSGGVEVLTEADQKKEEEVLRKQKLNQANNILETMIDNAFPKEKRGVAGYLASTAIKFVGKKILGVIEKKAATLTVVSEAAAERLRTDENVQRVFGDLRELEAVWLDQGTVNGEYRVQVFELYLVQYLHIIM